MATIALEVVPTAREDGRSRTLAEARKVKTKLQRLGLEGRINTVLIPQVIPEDEFRPVDLEEKLDPLDSSSYLGQELAVDFILTQVTVFTPQEQLRTRVRHLTDSGINRVVFVGAPRQPDAGEMIGPTPNEALETFRHEVPSSGVILIPTRVAEHERFTAKLNAGADFGVTQLLFSDYIVEFLKGLREGPHRPEIILSFGYVPKIETKVGLFHWLIWDETPVVREELRQVEEIAQLPFRQKKARMVELYKRVIDGAVDLGFPLGLHFEAPYGISDPAMETFDAMLDVWSPDRDQAYADGLLVQQHSD